MKGYYTIKPETAFGDPVYIHSHVNTLLESQKKSSGDLRKIYEEIKRRIENIYVSSLKQAEDVLNYLEVETNKLIEVGFNFDNIFGDSKDIFNQYIEPYRRSVKKNKATMQLSEEEKDKIVNIIMNDSKTKSIIDSSREALGEYAATLVSKNLEKMLKKKKISYDDSLINNFKEEDIIKYFPGRSKNSISKNFSKDLVKKIILTDPDELVNFFDNMCNDFLKINEQFSPGVSEKNWSIIIDSINNIKKSKKAIQQKMGSLKELTDLAGIDIILGKNKNVISSIDLVGATDHAFTSDLLLKMDKISTGISVKLNPKRLAGRNISIFTEDDNNQMIEGKMLNELIDDNIEGYRVYNILAYYMANYEALRTFAVDFNDTKLRASIRSNIVFDEETKTYDLEKSKISWTSMSISGLKVYNILEDIRKSVFLGIITKLLLGYAFGTSVNSLDKQYDEEKIKKGLPLILMAGDKVMWTKDILKNCITIIKDIKENGIESKYSFGGFYFYNDQKKYNKGSLMPMLKTLFIEKLFVKRKKNTENRYEEIKVKGRVSNQMALILNTLGFEEEGKLKDLLLNKWGIRYDYSNLN